MESSQSKELSVLVIGSGSTGSAIAHDLALRGFKTTLVERGEIASGTTGRNHCLLHSGARYCVKDKPSAIACNEENFILRKIMPGILEMNGGFFTAIDDSGMEYKERFVEGCEECGIPYKELSGEESLRLEPYLTPEAKASVLVPDGCFDPMRFCYAFLATAKKNGAKVLPFTEVKGFLIEGNQVVGVRVWDRVQLKEYDIHADMVVNATGPWSDKISALADVDVPVIPTPGVMISMDGRFGQRIISRMNMPSNGDLVVMQRNTSIIGTSSWPVEDADYVDIPEDHIEMLYRRGFELIPALATSKTRGIFVVCRPLLGSNSKTAAEGRDISRSYSVLDHSNDGVEGFITIIGGKTTDSRGMAESTVDVVCQKFGIDIPCTTKDVVLESYREFYRL